LIKAAALRQQPPTRRVAPLRHQIQGQEYTSSSTHGASQTGCKHRGVHEMSGGSCSSSPLAPRRASGPAAPPRAWPGPCLGCGSAPGKAVRPRAQEETPRWGRGTEAAEPSRGDRREGCPPSPPLKNVLARPSSPPARWQGRPPAAPKAYALHTARCSSSPAPALAAGARRTPRAPPSTQAVQHSLLFLHVSALQIPKHGRGGGAGCSPAREEATQPHYGKLMVSLQPAGLSTAPHAPGATLIKTAIEIRPCLSCA